MLIEQGAYGILAEVESHPFPTDAMLFMDWRDDHTAEDPKMQESNRYIAQHLHADMHLFMMKECHHACTALTSNMRGAFQAACPSDA